MYALFMNMYDVYWCNVYAKINLSIYLQCIYHFNSRSRDLSHIRVYKCDIVEENLYFMLTS